MPIENRSPRNNSYDWSEIAILAESSPGEWFVETSPDRPRTTARDIRRGTPKVFLPAGSFDALQRKDGLYIRYLGVPLYPWKPWLGDPRSFDTLERTLKPHQFPDPEGWDADVATALVDMTLREYVAHLRAKLATDKNA